MFEALGYKVEEAVAVVDFDKFAKFVEKQHVGQTRRDKKTPYFTHCMNVANHAATICDEFIVIAPRIVAAGDDVKQVCRSVCKAAGCGHDLFEDTCTDYEDVVRHSCDEVAATISWVSDDKRMPSNHRHEHYVARIAAAPLRAQIVKLADLLDNGADSIVLVSAPTLSPGTVRWLCRWHHKAIGYLDRLGQLARLPSYAKCVNNLQNLKERLDKHLEISGKAT